MADGIIIRNHAEKLKSIKEVHFRTVNASGEVKEQSVPVAAEHILEVFVNGQPAVRLSCTPSDLPELVLGRLYTERLIHSLSEVEELFICGQGEIAEVRLKEGISFRPADQVVPTCCTGNVQILTREETTGEATGEVTGETTGEMTGEEKVREEDRRKEIPGKKVDPETVFRLAEAFQKDSELHRVTGGTHSCLLYHESGEICGFEDIGRHNALDKAVGHMLLSGYRAEDCALFTTGRVAEDLAKKAVAAGIPVLISKAVPTDAALRLAEESGLTLIVRAWPDSYREVVPVIQEEERGDARSADASVIDSGGRE